MTRRSWWLLATIIAALALTASANSLANGFAYDDVYVIANASPRMHTLDGWWREFAQTYWRSEGGGAGDGYRPFTILAFKTQWVLGGGQPIAFHAVNVSLHLITAVAMFWLACAVLPTGAAFIAAALYAVHPVHVEAIANVVGQSELAVALLMTAAMALYVHGRALGPVTSKRWTVIGALYAAALLFKEHAITLVALIPLAELTVVRDRAPLRKRLADLRLPLLALTLVAATYLLIRSRVVIGTGFQPFIVFQALDLSSSNRVLTMIGAAPEWVRLFLWPARLLTEYTPPYIDVAQGPSITQLAGLVVLVGILGIAVASWRRSPVATFGIGWLVLTLLPASNFLVPAGFIIAERTLLLPSVGVMLAIGSAIPWLYERVERSRVTQVAAAAALVALVSLGTWRSITRNRVWMNNDTLFRQAVRDSPESYRAHFMLGTHLFENKRKTEGEMHYRRALQLFPYDPLMAYALAEQYRGAGMCAPAIPLYQWFFSLEPQAGRGHIGYATCLLLSLRPEEARAAALRSLQLGGRLGPAREIISAAKSARDSLDARRARGDSVAPVPPVSRSGSDSQNATAVAKNP